MFSDWFRERRADKKEETRENRAFDAAREAGRRAVARGKSENVWPELLLREIRAQVRRETGVIWGAMHESADPPEHPRPTLKEWLS